MRIASLAALFMLATAASAQESTVRVEIDLDRDGRPEAAMLIDSAPGESDLLIVTPDGRRFLAPAIAWRGGMSGQEPYLGTTEGGSLTLTSINESIGRHRWSLMLTIAWRDNAYRVAGWTYFWRDTLEPDNYGTCDANLLTGRGEARLADAPVQPLAIPRGAPLVTDWRADGFFLPAICVG